MQILLQTPELLLNPILRLIAGLLLGVVVAWLAWRVGSLNTSGAWAAALTGGAVFGLGGLAWAVVLLTFFLSSSALSRLFRSRKIMVSEKFSKGSRRDWGQVLANGGLGSALAIAHYLLPGAAWPWLAFTGAMAAVNADTWATEMGVLSASLPRLVTTGKPVERGTSGGISGLGSLAALGGAALVGLAAALFPQGGPAWVVVGIAAAAGLAGAFFDSLLGATVQAIYYCPRCEKETERHPLHTCQEETLLVRGWRWLDNDWVNFLASLVGALTALGLAWLLAAATVS